MNRPTRYLLELIIKDLNHCAEVIQKRLDVLDGAAEMRDDVPIIEALDRLRKHSIPRLQTAVFSLMGVSDAPAKRIYVEEVLSHETQNKS
jgi:hypothetical protein